jgi:hypothetical protein
MLKDKVPLFVLSMDSMREGGFLGHRAKDLHKKFLEVEKLFSDIVKGHAEHQQKERDKMKNPLVEETAEKWASRLEKMEEGLCRGVSKKILEEKERGKKLREEGKLEKERKPEEYLNPCECTIKKYIDSKEELRAAIVEANARAYAETVRALVPAIIAGKRVTLSLQGDDNKKSPAYVGLAVSIQQRMSELLGTVYHFDRREIHAVMSRINIYPPRLYTGAGRAKNILNITEDRPCTLIPDPNFTREVFGKEPYRVNRGVVGSNGGFYIQVDRYSRTYNDTIDGWKETSDNPWRKVDLGKRVDTMEVKAPEDFSTRVCRGAAEFREKRTPSLGPIDESLKLEDVYPLSKIKDPEDKAIIIDSIRKYMKDNGYEDGHVDSLEKVSERYELIIKALIPCDAIEDSLVSDVNGKIPEPVAENARGALARKFVAEYVPVVSGPEEDRKTMAQMFVIKSILKELGIETLVEGEGNVAKNDAEK